MRHYLKWHIIFISTFAIYSNVIGQCPSPNFTIPSDACINQQIIFQNTSLDGDKFSYDFCAGALEGSGTLKSSSILSTLNQPFGISHIFDTESGHHSFVANYNSNSILRIDDGFNLTDDPNIVNLGDLGGMITNPLGIKIFLENSIYFAIVTQLDGSVFVLKFGSGITEMPSISSLGTFSGINTTMGMDFTTISDEKIVLIVAGGSNGQLIILNFGSSFDNPPVPTIHSISGGRFLNDIAVANQCDNWFGLISGYSSGLQLLDFNSDITSEPTVTNITGINNTRAVELIQDGENYFGIVLSQASQSIIKLDYQNDMNNTPIESDLGDYGELHDNYGMDLMLSDSSFIISTTGHTNDRFIHISFDRACVKGTGIVEQNGNIQFEYFKSSVYNIALKATNSSGVSSTITQSININPNTAPPISFTDNNNECLGQENSFTPSNLILDTYEWSFDNGTTIGSTDTSPSHTFSQTGDSIVTLTVNDGTCSNFIKDTISIYPEPVTPTFSTPGAPYCTGADLAFENLFDESNYNGANLTYGWNYNGEGISAERDGSFAFDSEGTKTITLTASIPGCSTPSAGTDINVIAGPDVDFSFEELCLGDDTQFTNGTTGTGITGQTWNFGDGIGTSSASSPTYSYAAHGNYDVSLTVNNNQGCSNELTLPITIDDKPVASFNHGPACEGVDISFLDESSVDGLANITSYEWDFEGLGTSTNQNPNFTFDNQGSYDVELIVETTAGCQDTVTSTVNVLLAPAANFEVGLGCINTETIFLDKSEGDFSNPITQWIWTIDGSLASYSSSFGEVYNDASDHTISLLVRSANSCQSVHNDNFTISELPVVDFTVEKACDNESTVFQDATNSSSAAIESYSWQFDNQGSSTSNPATHQFTSAGSYTVGLNIIDETGCEGSIQKTVTIHPSPTAIINANSDIGPAPLMIDFTDESQSTQSSFWLFGDEDESTSSENNPQFTYNNEGDYTAQLISTNDLGCSDTTSLAITVADPILDLELVQISTEESEEKTSVSLTVRNSGNVILHGFDIRIDLDNNSSIFESYSGTITRGKSITYPLNFTFSSVGNNIGYTCITLLDRVEEFEDINIVNNESCIDFNQQLIIENSYPNPVRSTDTKIRFNMILPADGPVQIFLLNATGAVLYQETYMEAKAGLNSFFLDIYSFEQGMYFIKTVYDQNESTQRFVKM